MEKPKQLPPADELEQILVRSDPDIAPLDRGNKNELQNSETRAAEALSAENTRNSISPRPKQYNCQHEPPYPDHETVLFSLRFPDMTVHFATRLCGIQEGHLIRDCGEWQGYPLSYTTIREYILGDTRGHNKRTE